MRNPLIRHFPQNFLKFKRLRSSVWCRLNLSGETIVNRTENSHLETRSIEDLLHKVSDRCFAIGSDHSDQAHLGGGIAEEIPGKSSQNRSAVIHLYSRDSRRRGIRLLMNDKAGTPLYRIIDIIVAIDLEARHGNKEATGDTLP